MIKERRFVFTYLPTTFPKALADPDLEIRPITPETKSKNTRNPHAVCICENVCESSCCMKKRGYNATFCKNKRRCNNTAGNRKYYIFCYNCTDY